MLSNPKISHTILFVWIGNPMSSNLMDKMWGLQKSGYDVFILYDSGSTAAEFKSKFDDQIKNLEKDKIKNINIKSDINANQMFSILSDYKFSSKEIYYLTRLYLLYLYGHDYLKDKSQAVNKIHQNYAAAADILRLIGMLILQKKSHGGKNNKIMYLDHDTFPNDRLLNNPGTPVQVHQLADLRSVTGEKSKKISIDDISLNNAVIRVDSGESQFLCDSLHVIAKRSKKFFKLNKKFRQLITTKHPLSENLRFNFVFFISGPSVFESLIDNNVNFINKKISYLYDKISAKKYNREVDFDNQSMATWLKPHSFETFSYDSNNPVSFNEFYFRLSSLMGHLSHVYPPKPERHKKISSELKSIQKNLRSTTFPQKDLDVIVKQDFLSIFFEEKDYKDFIKLFYPDLKKKNNFIALIDKFMKNDKEKRRLSLIMALFDVVDLKFDETSSDNLNKIQNFVCVNSNEKMLVALMLILVSQAAHVINAQTSEKIVPGLLLASRFIVDIKNSPERENLINIASDIFSRNDKFKVYHLTVFHASLLISLKDDKVEFNHCMDKYIKPFFNNIFLKEKLSLYIDCSQLFNKLMLEEKLFKNYQSIVSLDEIFSKVDESNYSVFLDYINCFDDNEQKIYLNKLFSQKFTVNVEVQYGIFNKILMMGPKITNQFSYCINFESVIDFIINKVNSNIKKIIHENPVYVSIDTLAQDCVRDFEKINLFCNYSNSADHHIMLEKKFSALIYDFFVNQYQEFLIVNIKTLSILFDALLPILMHEGIFAAIIKFSHHENNVGILLNQFNVVLSAKCHSLYDTLKLILQSHQLEFDQDFKFSDLENTMKIEYLSKIIFNLPNKLSNEISNEFQLSKLLKISHEIDEARSKYKIGKKFGLLSQSNNQGAEHQTAKDQENLKNKPDIKHN